jgi:cysteine desulfurase
MKTVKKRKVYLDHAATTPLDSKVFSKMRPYLAEKYGNPRALYALGREAKVALVVAREQVAKVIHSRPEELIFTSGATESDNLVLLGVARANKSKGNKILISAVEHKGILSVAQELKKEGFEIMVIPVQKDGLLDLQKLEELIDEKTILVSVTAADSETGTIQPLKEVSKIIAGRCLFHTDATQAAVYLDLDVKKLSVDLMTLSAHKIYGPKGVGALYVRQGVRLAKSHSGTENVPAIVGFGEALTLVAKNRKREAIKVKKLRDELERGIFQTIPKVLLNGHKTKRLPNFLNVSILDIEGEAMLLYLDELGIMAGTGSACDAENLKPSAVLTAMGNPYDFVHGSLRFTLGRQNTSAEVKYVLRELPKVVAKLRKISPLCLTL